MFVRLNASLLYVNSRFFHRDFSVAFFSSRFSICCFFTLLLQLLYTFKSFKFNDIMSINVTADSNINYVLKEEIYDNTNELKNQKKARSALK